jgi:hypothetical protein
MLIDVEEKGFYTLRDEINVQIAQCLNSHLCRSHSYAAMGRNAMMEKCSVHELVNFHRAINGVPSFTDGVGVQGLWEIFAYTINGVDVDVYEQSRVTDSEILRSNGTGYSYTVLSPGVIQFEQDSVNGLFATLTLLSDGTYRYDFVDNDGDVLSAIGTRVVEAASTCCVTRADLLAVKCILDSYCGCTATVVEPEPLPTPPCSFDVYAEVVQPLCEEGTGEVTLTSTGVGEVTYAWDDDGTGAHREDLPAGTYVITATDQLGCTGELELTILPLPNGELGGEFSIEYFAGACRNRLTFTPSGGQGPYTVIWRYCEGGAQVATGETFNAACCGTCYEVVVTDANGCSYIEQYNVVCDPCDGFSVEIDAEVPGCAYGGVAGETLMPATLSVNITGGTAPFSYLWSGGLSASTSPTYVQSSNGTYNVTVTDAEGCTANDSYSLVMPLVPSASHELTSGDSVGCEGNVTITLSNVPAGLISWLVLDDESNVIHSSGGVDQLSINLTGICCGDEYTAMISYPSTVSGQECTYIYRFTLACP